MNQHEYVEGVLQYYKDNDIVQGDPNEGPWEEAHYPLPRGMGDEVILLKPEHHFIQGILQSEDVGRCCFWIGKTKQFLRSDFAKRLPEDHLLLLTQLYDKWSMEQKKAANETNRRNKTGAWDPKGQSEKGKIGGKIGGAKTARLGIGIHTHESRSKGGRKGGATTAKKTLNKKDYYCPITGLIGSAGTVARVMKQKGIDPSLKRKFTS